MITLSESASKELASFFASHDDARKSIRVFFAPGGCCGPVASMALDDASDGDETEVLEGITFCMQKELYEKVGAVSVDLGYMGFSITTERPFADPGQSGCSSCGGGCSSCH